MTVRILSGDCRATLAALPAESVHCCVTSPPYFGLRDYGHDGQIGLEPTPDAYVAQLVDVFRAVRRVLRDDGTLWLNLGDSYFSPTATQGRNEDKSLGSGLTGGTAKMIDGGSRTYRRAECGLKPKDLIGIPWRVAFALQADGWYLRQDVIWHKPNPMPESVTDRCTKAHEYVFLLSKGPRYWFDAEAIAEPALAGPPGNVARQDKVPGLADHNNRSGLHAYAARQRAARKDSQSHAGMPPQGNFSTQTRHTSGSETGTRNRRSVWTIATQPFADAHFATMAPELAETCIAAGCPPGGTVLDPFGGAGTTGLVADRMQRDAVLCELNPEYIQIAERRISGDAPLFAEVEAA